MALNARRDRQLHEAVAPLLLQDERVELTSLAGVGSVSVRKQALTAAVVGVVTAGSAGNSKKAFLGLQYVTHLTVAGQERGLKVTFPVQHRGDGPRFSSALPVTR